MSKTHKFKPVLKDQLFYGQYTYCFRFRLPEVNCLKQLDHEYITNRLEFRKANRQTLIQRYNKINPAMVPLHISRWKPITRETEENLHAVADILLGSNIPYKMVVSTEYAWIYTNGVQLINQLDALQVIYARRYSQAVVNRPKDTLLLKEPKHLNRSFFKSVKLLGNEKDAIKSFLLQHTDEIRISPAMLEWLNQPYHRIQDYFFIDHNGDGWLVLLGLIKPHLIRKTCELIKA